MTDDRYRHAPIGPPIGRRRLLTASALTALAATGTVGGSARSAERVLAGQAEDAGTLPAMLRLAPAPVGRPGQIAAYANAAAQLEAVGLTMPRDRDDDDWPLYLGATFHLYQSPDLLTRAFDPAWRETFGFDIFQVDQSLLVGEPPNLTTLFRGRFAADDLRAAWRRTGYRTVATEVTGATVASLYEEPEAHLDSPIVQLALTSMNNAAVLPDGTLACSSSLDGVRAVLAVVAGEASLLAEEPGVAALIEEMGSDIASAILVDGTLLRASETIGRLVEGDPQLEAVATRLAAENPMPPVRLALFGVTLGGPVRPFLIGPDVTPVALAEGHPEARFRIVLLLGSAAAAEAAVGLIEYRLDTGRSLRVDRPLAEFFPASQRRVTAVPGTPIVTVDLGYGEEAPLALWRDMLLARDVGFVAW